MRVDGTLNNSSTARFLDLLAPEEKQRYRRLPGKTQQGRFLLAHAFLRCSLSQYFPVPPRAWRYAYNPQGRAEVSRVHELPTPRFSLSYCRNYVACAIAHHADIGIDIETTQPMHSARRAASRYLSPQELSTFAGCADSSYASRYIMYWTLKEAYLKARGTGFTIDPRAISFDVENDSSIRITFDRALGGDLSAWQFALRRPAPSHTLALAAKRESGSPLDVVVYQAEPDQLFLEQLE